MAAGRVERRLAAVLAADVVGYSRLMERDEQGTLERLKVHRKELVDLLIAEHRGRLVKVMGDGLLAEFASVVDAVACAVAIQNDGAEDFALRIGINLGDVVVDGTDLYGDGVNVAARLEALAEPGGIVVSGTVWDHLHGQPSLRFASLGEQQLKNIARPVRAYCLLHAGAPAPAVTAARPERPSIAVLPFDNMSGDPGQAYFSDGLTEDLITELARFRDLMVLARHSSFALRGEALGAVALGRRLGVRYLLEGSVRKSGDRVRVTAQLIDAVTGDHLWAEHYDRALDDIFAVQDEVVATIVATLAGRIRAVGLDRAKRKPTSDLVAYDCVLRGLERLADYGAEANAAARGFFERAIALDPDYALAHGFLALAIFNQEWGDAAAAMIATCLDHASRAVALEPSDSRCHRILALVLLSAHEFERADFHSARSVALNPNDSDAAVYRSYILSFLGQPSESLAALERALSLNPFHPAWYWTMRARALFGVGRHAEAIAAFERVEQRRYYHYARLAICHAALGHTDEVRRCIGQVLANNPNFSSGAWVATLPFRHEADRERLRTDLLAIDLPA